MLLLTGGKPIQNNNFDIGIIDACDKHIFQCKYKCCNFNENYIVLYPGEYEATNLNKSHIKIINDDYFGGKKAVCIRHCKKKDFKPIDCVCYPYFPKIDDEDDLIILKGIKCPLKGEELVKHKEKFKDIWNCLLKNKKIFRWLQNMKLIGYKEIEK